MSGCIESDQRFQGGAAQQAADYARPRKYERVLTIRVFPHRNHVTVPKPNGDVHVESFGDFTQNFFQ